MQRPCGGKQGAFQSLVFGVWGWWCRMGLEQGLDGHQMGFALSEQVPIESSCSFFQRGTESLMERSEV